MKSNKPITAFAPHEVNRFLAPLALASVFFMVIITLDGMLAKPVPNPLTILYGIGGAIYILAYNRLVASSTYLRKRYSWMNSIISGIGLGLLIYILPPQLKELHHILIIFGAIVTATISGRYHTYVNLLIIFIVSLPGSIRDLASTEYILDYSAAFVISIIAVETYLRIKDTAQQHIQRLETVNKVSHQLMQSLDTEQVLALLNATILETIEADTYFVGMLKGDNIQLDLFYDDGEFYNGTTIPIEGTLTNWIINNQRALFLPDLREDVQLEGVKVRIIGKEKTSLSWIGVPLKAANINGVMALASYKPNSFDLADLELLSSLAQHVTLALDNTIRHAQVEEQARLDSMTGVYNHGYFLERLAEQAKETALTQAPLSLIMLDIDYFKRYNDTYGHLVGDRILNSLCTAIKQHIKQGDAVGRWGGEEFIISLPHATGEQAMQVAKRIGETMAILRVEDRDQRTVPVPTVSQGIGMFPTEANEIYQLIDLADRRLYVAKERGRNQIEPDLNHWLKIQEK
ncbi:MAG: sensor domain-containing diguanylate cyclase [Chloroflexota bacterium]